jgi:3-deoxy-manno-octulosonate cytidylyltransferase (CMP-KDO synthetase)
VTQVLAVIPARWASTRFPGKPLATLWGKPLLQHVWERARAIPGVDRIVVATDDERIARAAGDFGAAVEMTAADHESGTDRVAEVARRHPEASWIINLQGDEPEFDAQAVAAMVALLRERADLPIATLAHEEDAEALASPHVVKVAVDDSGRALYFSRVETSAPGGGRALRHVGIYGFQREVLLRFASLPPGREERAQRLEQLRALEHGMPIGVVRCRRGGHGVDTPEQLRALEERGPHPMNPVRGDGA